MQRESLVRQSSDGLVAPPSPRSPGKKKKKKRRKKEDPVGNGEAEMYGLPPSTAPPPPVIPNIINDSTPPFIEEKKEEMMAMGRNPSVELVAEKELNKEEEEGEEEEEEEREYEMEEDVYTLMFVYGCSFTSLYAFLIVLMQLTIIGLFYTDVLKDPSDGNKLKVPVAVDVQVQVAQFMSLPLCVMTHEDCTTAIYQLGAQYDPAVREKFPGATRFTWMFTLFLRFVVGFLLVFISFIQVVQSNNMTDLFLNLEAIVFVGNIDNFAFWLAEKNFLVQFLKDSCDAAKDISFKASHGYKRTFIRRIVMLLTFFILVAGYLFTAIKQNRGVYLKAEACSRLDVAFGDFTLILNKEFIDVDGDTIRNYFPGVLDDVLDDGVTTIEVLYSSFSGTYRIGEGGGEDEDKEGIEVFGQRAVYYEVVPGTDVSGDKSQGKFFYCAGAWIFTIPALQKSFDRDDEIDEESKKELEECGRWLLRSAPTEEFFLENVPTDNWRIWTGTVDIAEGLHIVCTDCAGAVDCNYHGECNEDHRCVCNEDGFGPTCGLDPPCPQLEAVSVGESTNDYLDLGTFSLLDSKGKATTEINDLLLVYGRPVYYHQEAADLWNYSYYIYFLGSRWNVGEWELEEFENNFIKETPGHSFWDQLFDKGGIVISEPTRSGSPLNLKWEDIYGSNSRGSYGPFQAREPFRYTFNCTSNTCPGANFCGQFGYCEDGQCVCEQCFGGYFCEFPPTENYALDAFLELLINGINSTELEQNAYVDIFWSDLEPLVDCCEYLNLIFDLGLPCDGRRLLESDQEYIKGLLLDLAERRRLVQSNLDFAQSLGGRRKPTGNSKFVESLEKFMNL